MAASAIPAAHAPAAAASRDRLGEFAFVAFLLLVFVGLKPFAVRDPVKLALGESGFTGAGDTWRQITYLAAFALLMFAAWRARGSRMLEAVPAPLACLLAWCVLSAFWSDTPDVTLRRAGLEGVIVLSALLGVETLGSERSLALWKYVLAGVLIVNWLSIPLVHQAVHLPGEGDAQLIGNWRGLYFHKNIAGSVSAITATVFFFEALKSRRATHWLLCLAAVGFTVMTNSKSSIGLLPFGLAAGLIYGAVRRNRLDRLIATAALGVFLVVAGAGVMADYHDISRFLTDPGELTGRVAIWQGELAFIGDHPLLGAGFGSFANAGALSPLHNYVLDSWVRGEAHGHNAYLQLLVTIGGIGFVLALLALVMAPLRRFLGTTALRDPLMPMLFAVFVFMLLHNFVESDFLESDGPAWIAFVLMLALLRRCTQRAPRADAEPARSLAWRLA
jgi:O-antigen ligase